MLFLTAVIGLTLVICYNEKDTSRRARRASADGCAGPASASGLKRGLACHFFQCWRAVSDSLKQQDSSVVVGDSQGFTQHLASRSVR